MFAGGNPIVMLKLTGKSVHQLRATKTRTCFVGLSLGKMMQQLSITIVKDVISDQSACCILVIG